MTGSDHEPQPDHEPNRDPNSKPQDELSAQLDELWARQENPMPLTDTSQLIDSLKIQQHQERRRLVRLNLQEVIPATALTAVFGGIGLAADTGAASFLGAAALCGSVGLFLLISTLRQRRVESRFDGSVQGELHRTLSQLRHRARLHRTVLWWYLTPLLIAITLVFSNSRQQTGGGVTPFDISYGVVVLGAFGFLYRANQKVAAEQYDPEIVRHERLLNELDH